ncbi:hypothetical protein MTsDn1_09760 [Alteromonas sp. MTD1]|uniref:substrate-binding domain-containing protein n=1 Tax=Alteromonas sp. MTD1 TaxID=3057962 RepID=UPI0036F20FDC
MPFHFLFILLFFVSFFAKADLPNEGELKPISIVTVERPPYTSDVDKRKGFLSEVVESAFFYGGYNVIRYSMPWTRAKLQIMTGEADVIFPASYEDVVDINGSRVLIHNTLPVVLVKHTEQSDKWNGRLESLKGHSVASHRGMLISDEYSNFTGAHKVEIGTTEQLFNMVQKRRIDFAITDRLTADYMLQMPAYKDLVVLSPPYISSSELYLGISEADDQKDSIKQAFEEGFAHLKRSGTYQEILSRYQIDDNIQMIPDETPVATYLEPSRLRSLKGSGLPPRTIKSSSDKINVAIIGFSWSTDTYQSTYIEQFTEMAEMLGVNVAVHDAKGSIEQQNNLMKQVIDNEPDVVAFWPVHGDKVKPALQYAYEAGIPVFLVNTPVAEGLWKYVRGYIGPDNYKEGRLAAEMMDTALGGKGKVVEIQGFPGYKTAVLRSLGFHHYLQERRQHDSEFDIEVIDVSSGYWSRERSYTTMERVIRRHSEFDGLYAADDNMALGAMQALTDANWPTDLKVTSATLFGDGYDAIKQGKIWGSVWQSPTEEADLAVKILVRFMLGDDVPLLTFLPVKPITKSALENTVRPEF